MSEYTSYRYSARPGRASHEILIRAGLSGELTAISTDVDGLIAESRDLAARQITGSPPKISNSLQRALFVEIGQGGLDAARLRDSLSDADANTLGQAAGHLADRLQEASSAVVLDAFGSSLTEMGYTLRPLRSGSGIKARHTDGTAVAVTLDPSTTRAEVDLSGFAGGACTSASKLLEDKLARRGVKLTISYRDQTACGSGGQFMQSNGSGRAADRPRSRTRNRR